MAEEMLLYSQGRMWSIYYNVTFILHYGHFFHIDRGTGLNLDERSEDYFGFAVILLYMVLLMVVVGSNLHKGTQQKYKIAPKCKCQELLIDDKHIGFLEDICCMTMCRCCLLIQIARHTHNDKEYPGYCCTIIGLERGAPKIV
jgi:hypothetical protein